VSLPTCAAGYEQFDVIYGSLPSGTVGRIQPYCGGVAQTAIGSGLTRGSGNSGTYACPGTEILVGIQVIAADFVYKILFLCSTQGRCVCCVQDAAPVLSPSRPFSCFAEESTSSMASRFVYVTAAEARAT